MTKMTTEFSDIDTNTLTGALPVHDSTVALRRPSVVGASVPACVRVCVMWVPVRVPLNVPPVNYKYARERPSHRHVSAVRGFPASAAKKFTERGVCHRA